MAYLLSGSVSLSGGAEKQRSCLTEIATGYCLSKSQRADIDVGHLSLTRAYLVAPNVRDLEPRAKPAILSWFVQAVLGLCSKRPHVRGYQGRIDGAMTLHCRSREERSSTAAISSCCPLPEVVTSTEMHFSFCQASTLTLACGRSRNDVVSSGELCVAPPTRHTSLSPHLPAAARAIGVHKEPRIIVATMPTTRSNTGARTKHEAPPSKPKKGAAPKGDKKAPPKSPTSKKRAAPTEDKKTSPVPKKPKSEAPGDDKKQLAEKLISAHGELYLSQLGVSDPTASDSKTLFTVLLTSLLFSARISHNIAIATAKLLVKEGWDDVNKLRESTWQRRTEVLTEGGYTHYREKTATMLGDLSQLVVEKYGNSSKPIPSR